MSVKWHREMVRYAIEVGVADARIEWRGRHPAIVGTYRGHPIRMVLAGTPGDWRAEANVRGFLRRTCRRLEARCPA